MVKIKPRKIEHNMLDLASAGSSLMLDAAALCVGAGSKAWWRLGPVRPAPTRPSTVWWIYSRARDDTGPNPR